MKKLKVQQKLTVHFLNDNGIIEKIQDEKYYVKDKSGSVHICNRKDLKNFKKESLKKYSIIWIKIPLILKYC